MSDLQAMLSCSGIIIYGAGSVSKHIMPYLRVLEEYELCHIIGIAVTDATKNPSEMDGVTIREIASYQQYAQSAAVLIAVSPQIASEIKPCLDELGFQNVFMLTINLRDEILEYKLKQQFELEGMLDTQKIWVFHGVKLLNPSKLLVPNANNIINQVAELLYPPLKQDYSMVVEGPYEYGRVILEKNDIVLDCGANMGIFSAYAAYKTQYVLAFEPVRKLCQVVQQHIDLNGKGKVFAVGLSDKDGVKDFYENEYNIGGSSFVKQSSNHIIKIPCRSIDSLVKELNLPKVDFIKADIEGAERNMLQGAQETLKRFAPKLSLCTYHLPDDPQVLESLILRANPSYRIVHKWEKLFAWVENR